MNERNVDCTFEKLPLGTQREIDNHIDKKKTAKNIKEIANDFLVRVEDVKRWIAERTAYRDTISKATA